MSDLLRQSVEEQARSARPRPSPIATPILSEMDDHSSSSDSSASSAASIATVRPSSREQEAGPTHWTHYFEQELILDHAVGNMSAKYHVYLTQPKDLRKGPLYICHHGAGASGLSFAVFAQEIRRKLPDAGILSLEARSHGSVVVSSADGHAEKSTDFSLDALINDASSAITLTAAKMGWTTMPPTVLVGHSLGAAVMTTLADSPHFKIFGSSLIGYCVIDVVEGSAIEALSHMRTYLASRPSSFATVEEAISWHLHSRTIRDKESAQASVPSLLMSDPAGGSSRLVWRTDLSSTSSYWEGWFKGMSSKFLTGRGARMLILAGTDRLDRELMIGQMQGKFQLVVIPEAGHFVQEDVPEKTAGLLVEFFKRNDRSQMVLPPKVADLIKQGKKV